MPQRDNSPAEQALSQLKRLLSPLGGLYIAFSGGLDSRFLCHSALSLGLKVRALHLEGPHVPARESAWAVEWAAKAGLPLTRLYLDPLQDPQVAANGPERCYYCKLAIFRLLKSEVEKAGGGVLCDGSNASDLASYRPGLRALRELGIFSPLAEAGLAKADIRALAAQTGLDWPEQAARPCLLTRFNYGVAPTPEKLLAAQTAENAVEEALRELGYPFPFRLRFPEAGRSVLHVQGELDAAAKAALRLALESAGFAGAALESVTSLSGHFDRQHGLAACGQNR